MRSILKANDALPSRFLMVSDGDVFTAPHSVQTLLGSCVTVTFHLPSKSWGAAFHALLPTCPPQADKTEPFKYVDSAIHTIMAELSSLGAPRSDLVCKVFGGANAILNGQFGAGHRNVAAAFDTLDQYKIKVTASSVGGTMGRKLLFLTGTGEVYVQRIRSQQQS